MSAARVGLERLLVAAPSGAQVALRQVARISFATGPTAPMVGGIVTSFLLELTVYPAIFALWKGRKTFQNLKDS
jgi:Cu/Ag efflux pump CusA